MRNYSLIVEVVQTRAIQVLAEDAEQAEEIVRADLELIPFDVLEEEIQSVEIEEVSS